MTEEQAKKKWCPMVRMNLAYDAGKNVGSWNRDGGDCYCIASACMLWRWEEDWTHTARKIGYCGLGGKP